MIKTIFKISKKISVAKTFKENGVKNNDFKVRIWKKD